MDQLQYYERNYNKKLMILTFIRQIRTVVITCILLSGSAWAGESATTTAKAENAQSLEDRIFPSAPWKKLDVAVPLVGEGGPPLWKEAEIQEDTGESMLSERLQRADELVLVCYFESKYVPQYNARNGKLTRLWEIYTKGRVVQSLRGNIPVGSIIEVMQYTDETPPGTSYIPKDFDANKVQEKTVSEPGVLVYLLMERKDVKKEGGIYLYRKLDYLTERPAKFFTRELERFIKVRPASIAEESVHARLLPGR